MKTIVLKTINNFRQLLITLIMVVSICLTGFSNNLLYENLFKDKPGTSKKSNIIYLEMKGNVKEAKDWQSGKLKNMENAEFTIFNKEFKIIGRTYSNRKGICIIKLPLDNKYIIKISKQGWVTKIINVDTHLKIKKLKKYSLKCEIEMFENISGLDVSVLSKPVANVKYNNYLKSFDYDFLYTDEVNKKLKNNYLVYYKAHPENKVSPKSKKSNNTKRKYVPSNISASNNNKTSTSDKKYVGPNEKNGNINYKPVIDSPSDQKKEGMQKKSAEIKDTKSLAKKESSDIMFKIEILSIDDYLSPNAQFFKKFGNVNEYIYKGKNKYTIGEFKSFEIASKTLKEINNNGYKDAFLVAFYKGQRINMDEALSIKRSPK